MPTILGITHQLSGNSAAVLLVNGIPIAMAEEERFTRIKFAPSTFPNNSISYCFEKSGMNWTDIDCIAVGYSRAIKIFAYRCWQLFSSKQFIRIPSAYKKLQMRLIYEEKIDQFGEKKVPRYYVRHHIAHAASTYYASNFNEAVIFTLDGAGGEESGLLLIGKGTRLKKIESISNDNSWGMAWARITEHLGLKGHSDEGQIMGLASYGVPISEDITFIDWSHIIPRINMRKLEIFLAKVPVRKKGYEIRDEHKNLAATIQKATEFAVVRTLTSAYEMTGIKSYCLAGGVMLNCISNGKVAQLPFVENLFIQPASNDAGAAMGAALFVHSQLEKEKPAWKQSNTYYGPSYNNEQIEQALLQAKLDNYQKVGGLSEIAKIIAEGGVIGWFQGGMEFGPRALGSRSILADPRRYEIKDQVNLIKGRAFWRPLCPSILESELHHYVKEQIKFPDYMIVSYTASERAKREIPATVHVDNTLRPQAVSKDTHQKYWELIYSFKIITGVPALLNTSFNLANEPIVCSPQDAISTFLRSELDFLVIGDFIVWK